MLREATINLPVWWLILIILILIIYTHNYIHVYTQHVSVYSLSLWPPVILRERITLNALHLAHVKLCVYYWWKTNSFVFVEHACCLPSLALVCTFAVAVVGF